jgi:hypothetical protein
MYIYIHLNRTYLLYDNSIYSCLFTLLSSPPGDRDSSTGLLSTLTSILFKLLQQQTLTKRNRPQQQGFQPPPTDQANPPTASSSSSPSSIPLHTTRTPLFDPATLTPYLLKLLLTIIPYAALSNNHTLISNVSVNISSILNIHNVPGSSNGNPDNPNTDTSVLCNMISEHILTWRNIGDTSIADVYNDNSSVSERAERLEHIYDVLGVVFKQIMYVWLRCACQGSKVGELHATYI